MKTLVCAAILAILGSTPVFSQRFGIPGRHLDRAEGSNCQS